MFSDHMVQIWRCKLRPWQHSVGSLGNAICFCIASTYTHTCGLTLFLIYLLLHDLSQELLAWPGLPVHVLDSDSCWLLVLMVKHIYLLLLWRKTNWTSNLIPFVSFPERPVAFMTAKEKNYLITIILILLWSLSQRTFLTYTSRTDVEHCTLKVQCRTDRHLSSSHLWVPSLSLQCTSRFNDTCIFSLQIPFGLSQLQAFLIKPCLHINFLKSKHLLWVSVARTGEYIKAARWP